MDIDTPRVTHEFRSDRRGAGLFSYLNAILEWIYCVKQVENAELYINMHGNYRYEDNLFSALFKEFKDSQITTHPPTNPISHLSNHYVCNYPYFTVFPTDGMTHYSESKHVQNKPHIFHDPDFPLYRHRLQPIVAQCFQPVPELQERIDHISRLMSSPAEDQEPVLKVGIHIRCQQHYQDYSLSGENSWMIWKEMSMRL